MGLIKKVDHRKVACTFGINSEKEYIFLCSEEIFEDLTEGDFVVADVSGGFKIAKVEYESTEQLDSSIKYKHILKKL